MRVYALGEVDLLRYLSFAAPRFARRPPERGSGCRRRRYCMSVMTVPRLVRTPSEHSLVV